MIQNEQTIRCIQIRHQICQNSPRNGAFFEYFRLYLPNRNTHNAKNSLFWCIRPSSNGLLDGRGHLPMPVAVESRKQAAVKMAPFWCVLKRYSIPYFLLALTLMLSTHNTCWLIMRTCTLWHPHTQGFYFPFTQVMYIRYPHIPFWTGESGTDVPLCEPSARGRRTVE